MNTDDTTSEELGSLLREHLQQHYGETRSPAELWEAVSLGLSGTAAATAHTQVERDVARLTGEPWLPLPTLPPQKESSTRLPGPPKPRPLRRMAIIASSALAVVLLGLGGLGLATMLDRQLRTGMPGQTPVAAVLPTATSKSQSALATRVVEQGETVEPAGSQVFTLEPANWLLGGNYMYSYRLTSDNAVTYKGQPSARLEPRSPQVVGGATMQRLVIRPEYKGQRVRFSAYIKARNLDMPGGLWLQVSDVQPRLPLYDDARNKLIVGTTDWERRELVMDVPPDSESLSVGVLIGSQGEIWVSGAQLEVVGKDVPATSWPPGNNFDFEQGMAGWNYGAMSVSYYRGVDANVVHSGRLSGYVRSVASTRPSSGVLLQGLPAEPYLGKRLRLSAYIKAKNVEGWAGLTGSVIEHTGDGPALVPAYDNMGDRPIQGTSDWTRYSIVLDVPARSSFIYVELNLDGSGEVWIDDVQLEEVDTSVATTGITLVQQPQNTGFESSVVRRPSSVANWLVSGLLRGQYNVGVDAGVAHSGKSSASIKYIAPTPLPGPGPTPTYTLPANGVTNSDSPFPYSVEASVTRLEQSLDATQYAGKRIRLSAYFKTEGVGQYAGLWVSLVSRNSNINGTPPLGINVADAPVRGTLDWRKSEVVLDVPADIHTIGYGFGLVGDGQVWADDVQVEVVGQDVPVTQPAPSATATP